MKRLIRLFLGVLVPAFMLASVASLPAMAQDKAKDMKPAKAAKAEKGKVTVKVLHDDDRVRVQEVTFKPGDENTNVARPFRVVRALKGGTLERTYPDGKKDKLVWKTGEVKVLEASPPYVPKNVGKSDVVLYVVVPKQPKK